MAAPAFWKEWVKAEQLEKDAYSMEITESQKLDDAIALRAYYADLIKNKKTYKANSDRNKIEEQNEWVKQLPNQIGTSLTKAEQADLTNLLIKHQQVFAISEMEIGRCSMAEHVVNTGTAQAISQPPYKSAWKERELIQTYVDDMLEQNIIEPSDSAWSSPVVLVKKPDGKWRFCVDYRKLNAITERDVYPLPCIPDQLSRLQGSMLFSIMDLKAGFHQIPLREEDKKKSAFITADGLYQFNVMPFGMTNSPSTFQRTMDLILAGLKWTSCLIYLDDVVVFSTTFSQHLERLDRVFDCLTKAGLKLKCTKCRFAETSLKILGHIVSQYGIGPNPEKLTAVSDFPSPNLARTLNEKVKQVQSFIGLCSYYRRHIFNFSMLARPLIELTKKDAPFDWGEPQEKSFENLKSALTNAPVLAHPNYDLPMEIMCDACGYGIGGVLQQRVEDVEQPLAYASRLLSKAEQNYSITELECLALVWCLKKFRGFIWGTKITIITDHQALCWLMTKRDLAGRLARWSLAIQEHDIQIVYRSGKLHTNADCLSRYPITNAIDKQEEEHCLLLPTVQETDIMEELERKNSLADEQKKFPAWKKIMDHLQAGYRRQSNFCLKEGLLYLQTYKDGKAYHRLCVPFSCRKNILKALHDDVISGHLGVKRTLAKATSRFYWPRMSDQIQRYIRSCPSCQGRKAVPDKPAGFLQCIKVEQPFEKVGLDLLGPFPVSKNGNRMVAVSVDYLTKWVDIKALPTGKADDVADHLVDLFLKHGAPRTIITDRGKCFMSEVFQKVTKRFHTNHKTTSSYHPQCNGQTERMNHTIAMAISMYVSGAHDDWDEFLKFIEFALNTTKSDATGFSPYFLNHGREPVLPIDLELFADPNPLFPEYIANGDYATRVVEILRQARQIILSKMEQVKAKEKQTYDERHRDQSFQNGDLVLIYKPFRKVGKAEKLLHRWLGPYKVIRQTTPVNYEVQLASGRGKTDVVHVVSMKPFHEIYEQENTEEIDETIEPVELAEQIIENQNLQRETEIEDLDNVERQPDDPLETKETDIPERAPEGANENNTTPEEAEPNEVIGPDTRRRSTRIRKIPLKLRTILLLPYLLGMMTLFIPATKAEVPPIIREHTIFQERPGVAFSESSWTIVTDLDLEPADRAIQYLDNRIFDMTRMATTWKEKPTDPYQLLASKRIIVKSRMFRADLNDCKKRLSTFKSAITDVVRNKRALVDGGGSILKWLFGVATQVDLVGVNLQVEGLTNRQNEITHIIAQQATIVNESLWEIRTTTKMLAELREAYTTLGNVTTQLYNRVTKLEEYHFNQSEFFTCLEATFDGIAHVLQWLNQLANDFDVGLEVLASGRLAPQLFSPSQLETVLAQINTQLPIGWTIASSELWVTYREAQVQVAAVGNKFRLFIKIPIFDHTQRYTLFRIIKLPSAVDNGNHGIIYGNLPDYLAVSMELDTFLELSEADITECSKSDRPLCRFHTGVSRRTTRKSCAISLFLDDPARTQEQCRQKFIEWKGPEVAYIGRNKWAFSAIEEHDMVISCPPGLKQKPFNKVRLPKIGIFDIPSGCTARTEDWIFPASTEGKFEVVLKSSSAPTINITFPIMRNDSTSGYVLQLPEVNQTFLTRISELLLNTSITIASQEMTSQQIQQILREPMKTGTQNTETRYPYELVGGLLLISGILAYMAFWQIRLFERMKAHEQYDVVAAEANGEETTDIQMEAPIKNEKK